MKRIAIIVLLVSAFAQLHAQNPSDDKFWFTFGENIFQNEIGFEGYPPIIYRIEVSSDNFYVGGRFTHITDKNVNCIGGYAIAGKVWFDLDSGVGYSPLSLPPRVTDFAAMPNNEVFIGEGNYHAAGGPRPEDDKTNEVTGDMLPFYSNGQWLRYKNPEPEGRLYVTKDGIMYLLATFIYRWTGGSFLKVSDTVNFFATDALGYNLIDDKGDSLYFYSKDAIDPAQAWIKIYNRKTDEIHKISVRGSGPSYRALAVDDERNIYLGGRFSRIFNVNVDNIAAYSQQTKQWSGLGNGFNGAISSLRFGINGELYAGGEFTKSGDKDLKFISVWDGKSWEAMGSGLDSTVHFLRIDDNGFVYVGGVFNNAGGKASQFIARWDKAGSSGRPPIIVNTLDDKFDRSCDDDHCSFRDAIYAANLKSGLDTILFKIKGNSEPYKEIIIEDEIPEIIYPVIIRGDNEIKKPGIILNGKNYKGQRGSGLVLKASNSELSGLMIINFPDEALRIQDGSSNFIRNSYFGIKETDLFNYSSQANKTGVYIINSSLNKIGGSKEDRCIISGNTDYGLIFNNASDNEISNCYIGTESSGNSVLSNKWGLRIENQSKGNRVNNSVISGNENFQIIINNAIDNEIFECKIGINANGNEQLTVSGDSIKHIPTYDGCVLITTQSNRNTVANSIITGGRDYGIRITDKSSNNIIVENKIGTFDTEDLRNKIGIIIDKEATKNLIERNQISNSNGPGVLIDGGEVGSTKSNILVSNIIGLDEKMETVEANKGPGVLISNSPENEIGAYEKQNTISGNYGDGIEIQGKLSRNNKVYFNFIGVDGERAKSFANEKNGIHIHSLAYANQLYDNLISGNLANGILIDGTVKSGNDAAGGTWIVHNFIGTDTPGLKKIPNKLNGVRIIDSQRNNIGSNDVMKPNLISGNDGAGILIEGLSGEINHDNIMINNIIGMDITAKLKLPNRSSGVILTKGAKNNFIGSSNEGLGNTISGNEGSGILVSGEKTSNNLIAGNFIGTNISNDEVGNLGAGIVINDASHSNTIGGSQDKKGNIICGNNIGIYIKGSSNNTGIYGNMIGINKSGTEAKPNKLFGIWIADKSHSNIIGGNTISHRNFISGNNSSGIFIAESGTSENAIYNNFIGTDITGKIAIPNGGNGITISDGARNNYIGNPTNDYGNLISGNKLNGIVIADEPSRGNFIEGNLIGCDIDGSRALPNEAAGIRIENTRNSRVINNLISGNKEHGLVIVSKQHDIPSRNIIQNNRIGCDINSQKSISNGEAGNGIVINNSNLDFIENNIISGNELNGLYIESCKELYIRGNSIGTNFENSVSIPNKTNGIRLQGSSLITVGGSKLNRNRIANNGNDGIMLANTDESQIISNFIESNTGYGIRMIAGSDENSIVSNIIRNNQTGISIEDESSFYNSNVIASNEVAGNQAPNSGIRIMNSSPKVIFNSINRDLGNGISIKGNSNPIINYNNILLNEEMGVHNIDSKTKSNARFNWWGDASGPSGAGSGSGDEVSANVDYSQWLTKSTGLYSFLSTDTLFIPVGNKDSASITVRNLSNPADEIEIKVSDSKNWLVGDANIKITPDSLFGGNFELVFSIPSSAKGNSAVAINSISSSDPSESTRDTLIIVSYVPLPDTLIVIPDTVRLSAGERTTFEAAILDQYGKEILSEVSWVAEGGTIDTSGAYRAAYSSGTYIITAKQKNGTLSGQAYAIIDATTDINDDDKSDIGSYLVEIYPNPVLNELLILVKSKSSSTMTCNLYGILGNKVKNIDNRTLSGEHTTLQYGLNEVPPGSYFLIFDFINPSERVVVPLIISR